MSGTRAQRALYLVMVACLGLALVLVSISVAFLRTLAKPGYQDEVLGSSGYYEELTQTLRTGCASILEQVGMPQEQTQQILDQYVTQQTVRTAVQQHISAMHAGYSQDSVSTAYFPQAIHLFLELYEEGTGLYPEPEINTALVSAHSSCEYYFRNEVTVPFANAVSVTMQYSDASFYFLAVVAVLTAGSLALLIRLSGGVRELLAGCAASALTAAVSCAALGAIFLLFSGYDSWMTQSPAAGAFSAWMRGFFLWLPALGAVWLALSAVLLGASERVKAVARPAEAAETAPIGEESAPPAGQVPEKPATQAAPETAQAEAEEAANKAETAKKTARRAANAAPRGIGPSREIRTDRAARISRRGKE